MDLTEEEKEKLKKMIDMYDETILGYQFMRGLGKFLVWALSVCGSIAAIFEAIHFMKGGK